MFKPLRKKIPLRGRGRPVTVCVVATAAESSALVLISDKAVTRGLMVSDTAICKMSRIGDTPWHALISGDIAICDEVLLRSEEALAQKPSAADSFASMMRLVAKAYADTYESHLETETLKPKLLSRTDFANRPRRLLPLPDGLLDEIAEDRKKFEREWTCDLIVCGFESTAGAPRLFRVTRPGTAFGEDRLGFTAVGIGDDAAIGRLMFLESSRDHDLDRVLWDAFEAKVQAEIIQGVGYKWDGHIILKARPKEAILVPDKIHDLMDQVMNYTNWSPFDFEPVPRYDRPPKNWRRQVTRFTETLIPRTVKKSEAKNKQRPRPVQPV